MQKTTLDKPMPVQPNPLTKSLDQSVSQPTPVKKLIEQSPTAKNQRQQVWLKRLLFGFLIVCLIFVLIEVVILYNAKYLLQ